MRGMRLLVAEDHEAMRKILVEMLSVEFEVVGSVGDGQQLVDEAILLRPAVIVCDIAMPFMDGLSVRKELQRRGVDVPFVFLTMIDVHMLPFAAKEASLGYVHKADLVDELKLAIRAVALGKSYMSRSFRKGPKGP